MLKMDYRPPETGPARAGDIYAELWDFLRNPRLIDSQWPWNALVWRQLLLLFMLDLALVLISLVVIAAYEWLLGRVGIVLPDPIIDEQEGMALLVLAVFLAPPIEEVMFRGWLKGTPRHLLLLIELPLILVLIGMIFGTNAGGAIVFMGWALLILALIVVALTLLFAPRRPVPFFKRHFAWFFWLSCISFALVHVSNYEAEQPLLVVPMVLPQLLAAIILAFARMRFGLPASILLHGAANGILVALMVLTG